MIGKISKPFSNFLNNININNKLLIFFFIMIIIPLAVFTLVVYNKISADMKEKFIYSASQSLIQASKFLEYRVTNTIVISDTIYYNKNVQDILLYEDPDYFDDILQQDEDYRKLIDLLTGLQRHEGIYRVRLYVRDGPTYSGENVNIFNLKYFKNTSRYSNLVNTKKMVIWCTPENFSNTNDTKVISMLRKIRNLNQYEESIGVIRVDILEADIKDIISLACVTKNSLVFLQNEAGKVITGNNLKMIDNLDIYRKLFEKSQMNENTWTTMAIDNKKYLFSYKNINNTDWSLVSIIPYREILSTGSDLKNYLLIIMFMVLLATYIIAFIISRSSTKRIGILIRAMKNVEKGDFNTSLPIQGKDEIGQLMKKFDFMKDKISAMIEEQFNLGQKVKNAELKALQSQINPHFLYNTLDMINWSAAINDIHEIETTVQNLAKFYKLSLSKGRDIVSIRDEIEHVKTYIEIQNQRFENRIRLEIDIDERILEYSTLKIILQPIVENSILHGIMEKEDKTGTVKVSGRLDDNTIILRISDDGVGIPEYKLKNFLEEKYINDSHGYGVGNINERIKLYYGEQYGLTYKSELQKGTEVEIRIPATKISIEKDVN